MFNAFITQFLQTKDNFLQLIYYHLLNADLVTLFGLYCLTFARVWLRDSGGIGKLLPSSYCYLTASVDDKSLVMRRRTLAAPLRTMQSLVLRDGHPALLYTCSWTTALLFSSCSSWLTMLVEERWVEKRQTRSSQWCASCL